MLFQRLDKTSVDKKQLLSEPVIHSRNDKKEVEKIKREGVKAHITDAQTIGKIKKEMKSNYGMTVNGNETRAQRRVPASTNFILHFYPIFS